MDEETAFLNSIAVAPRDHLPRLVYADWLDEQERSDEAEFLRLLCKATKRDRGAVATRKRLKELRGVLDEAWCGRVKRGLHELVSQGELLDAAWKIYSDPNKCYHFGTIYSKDMARREAALRVAAHASIKRKCPGFTAAQYEDALDRAIALGDVVTKLVGEHGDKWCRSMKADAADYGIPLKDFDAHFRRTCPGFILATCRSALLRRFWGTKIA